MAQAWSGRAVVRMEVGGGTGWGGDVGCGGLGVAPIPRVFVMRVRKSTRDELELPEG